MSALYELDDSLVEDEPVSIFHIKPWRNKWGYPSKVSENSLWRLQIETYRLCEEPAYTWISEVTPPQTYGIGVPQPLSPILDVIDKSRWMLDLEDDWDGDGSKRYLEETWHGATDFLLRNAITLYNRFQLIVASPGIHNGPEGSIDIYWDTPKGKLLINIPPAIGEMASFFGRSTEGREIKGSLSLKEDNLWLLLWQTGK